MEFVYHFQLNSMALCITHYFIHESWPRTTIVNISTNCCSKCCRYCVYSQFSQYIDHFNSVIHSFMLGMLDVWVGRLPDKQDMFYGLLSQNDNNFILIIFLFLFLFHKTRQKSQIMAHLSQLLFKPFGRYKFFVNYHTLMWIVLGKSFYTLTGHREKKQIKQLRSPITTHKHGGKTKKQLISKWCMLNVGFNG